MKLLPLIVFVLSLATLIFLAKTPANAIQNPLSIPNNKVGIHILFDSELDEASRFVNSNNGEWGYVLIPIQAGDRNLEKWQKFMDQAKEKKVIPIIRLSTHGDYFNNKVWRKPNESDIIDFANFLNSLDWPTENRYVIIFNEVNRGDEWGGSPNPSEYAKLLSYSVTIFKSLSTNFFVISSGMDNASINGNGAMNQYDYIRAMNKEVPGIFNQIDGISSHSYPNPAFSQPPTVQNNTSIASFRFERSLAESMSSKKLPVFITETGWTSDKIPDEIRAEYYKEAFETVWTDPGVVTVIPFLLRANGGPFEQFSFLRGDGTETKQYEAIKNLIKEKGKPTVSKRVLGTSKNEKELPIVSFKSEKDESKYFTTTQATMVTLFWFLNL